jgi:hypothetical protein
MGLDMYLYAEKYISQRDYVPDTNDEEMYNSITSTTGMNSLPTPSFGGVTVSKCIGYWRKANAVHGWFVDELADGIDECQRIGVGREDLIKLRNDCLNELANRDMAVPNEKQNEVTIKDEENMAFLITQRIEEERNKINSDSPVGVLEPRAGFFFGSTDKDEWYYEQLDYTVDMINSTLACDSDKEYEYYYRASW